MHVPSSAGQGLRSPPRALPSWGTASPLQCVSQVPLSHRSRLEGLGQHSTSLTVFSQALHKKPTEGKVKAVNSPPTSQELKIAKRCLRLCLPRAGTLCGPSWGDWRRAVSRASPGDKGALKDAS